MTLNNATLREWEHATIRNFLERESHRFDGRRVLDYGCGQQPYRALIAQAGGDYYGYDRADLPANVSGRDIGDENMLDRDWDVIVVNQVIQYVPPWGIAPMFSGMRAGLWARKGVLLMTGPTTWPLVEPEDICRYTPNGIRLILEAVQFNEVEVEERVPLDVGVPLVTGWQVVAK